MLGRRRRTADGRAAPLGPDRDDERHADGARCPALTWGWRTSKTKSPQTNGICERFHKKTVLDEFYSVAFRKKLYRSLDELQADLDAWLKDYNEVRPHQGRSRFGKTPDADLR